MQLNHLCTFWSELDQENKWDGNSTVSAFLIKTVLCCLSCPSFPVQADLSRPSCHSSSAQAFRLSCLGFPVPAFLSRLIRPDVLSWLSRPASLAVLPRVFCPKCLPRLSCPGFLVLFLLSCSCFLILAVVVVLSKRPAMLSF
jgi:hypothetical protein